MYLLNGRNEFLKNVAQTGTQLVICFIHNYKIETNFAIKTNSLKSEPD